MTAEELKNVAGFKAVDAEGNELGVVSLSDIVSAVKQELQPSGVARASVAALSEVSAQAATDTYEDQLPQKTDVTWIRGLDESGNPILISKQSLVSVAEGLIGTVTENKNGLMNKDGFIERTKLANGETDLDGVTKSGMYQFENYNNLPISYGLLLVFKSRIIVTQLIFSHKNYGVYVRSNWNNEGWSEWKEF